MQELTDYVAPLVYIDALEAVLTRFMYIYK